MTDYVDKDDHRIDALQQLFAVSEGKRPSFWGDDSLIAVTFGLLGDLIGEEELQDLSNPEIAVLLGNLKSGRIKITDRPSENERGDIDFLIQDVNNYANERLSLGFFTDLPYEIYDSYTDDQREKLLNESGRNVLAIFLNQGYFWKVNADNVLYREPVIFQDQNAKFTGPFTDHLMKMSEGDALDNATSELIGEMVTTDYSFKQFKRDVAQLIQDVITQPSLYDGSKSIAIPLTDEYVNHYLELDLDDGFYSLPKALYSSGEHYKVPESGLSEAEVKSFQIPGVLIFPDTIIKDENNNIIEETKKELSNFNELAGTDITDYQFKFQIDAYVRKNIFGIDLTRDRGDYSWVKWLRSKTAPATTTNEQISAFVTVAYVEFLTSLITDLEANNLSDTIAEHYNRALDADNLNIAMYYIIFEKIISAKKSFFDSISQATAEDSVGGADITAEERERAYRNSVENFKTGQGESIPSDPLSEEDIENRQKYFKQCALMLNMPSLRDSYQNKLNIQYKGGIPYDGRFTTLRSDPGEQETMLSSLVSSAKEQKLFELAPHKISRLVPKIRLFKVFSIGSEEKEIEFIFDRTVTTDRPAVKNSPATKFMDVEFDKGTGVGLKNFSFEFNGTNPAEARNDITASLSLFFQSFTDFTRDRAGTNGNYRYVDLVIQPTPDEKGQYDGIDIQSDRQYEPQFYRIRAEVGYVVPTDIDPTGMNGFTSDERDAIRNSNKSFFLNMVDHDISFAKDGTVEIKISYRAYLESLLKHPRLDALASPELIKKRMENAKELSTQLRKRNCTVEQIKNLQMTLAAQERILIKKSLSSILQRLKNRKVIYTTVIEKEDKDFFLKKGFFQKCDFEVGVDENSEGVDLELVLNSDLPESSDDFDFMDSANRSVQFFYFGDLLYTIMDCVYSNGGDVRPGTGFKRNSILLGSFEFEPFQSSDSKDKVYNIADIPISVDFFSRWFVDNVVSQKSTRKTFPVMNFIRTLSNHLIKPSLIENCVNRKLETRLRLQTTQITAHSVGGNNPLKEHYRFPDNGRSPVSLEVSNLRASGAVPFSGGPVNDANSSFKDFHTFIVVSAIGSTLTYSGNGSYSEDIKNGRFHVHVGQNAGIVKSLSLSKSDQQYIREARFFQNGIDGLLQLSAVYVANIDMFGNTLFYPGMEIFFNPYGIGGSSFDPRKGSSMANKLGIGGYHTITSVKSSISPGKFTTSISAQQYYSGDGSGNPNIVKQNNATKETTSIDAYVPEDAESMDAYKKCKAVILNAQRFQYSEGSVTASIEEPVEEVVEEAASSEQTSTEPIEAPVEVSDPRITPSVEGAEVVTSESIQEPPTYKFRGEYITEGQLSSSSSSTSNSMSFRGKTKKGFFLQKGDHIMFFPDDKSFDYAIVDSPSRIYSREEKEEVE